MYFANINMLDLHRLSYFFIFSFVAVHLPTVFSHDVSSKCADISAMVNGYRIFSIEEPSTRSTDRIYTVSLEELLKTKR